MEKKYQVFISSTYTDLIEARTKVRDAILSMFHFPVGMELFGAANEDQWQIISGTIESSDYYVLIVGQRYGSVINDNTDGGISYTEKEFRYALEKGIPVLAFLINDGVAVKPEFMEKDYPEKLKVFKNTVKTGRYVDWWDSPDDLAQKVITALYHQINRTKRPGWIRGDAVDIEKSLAAMVSLSERNQLLEDENKALVLENQQLKQKPERIPRLTISIDADHPMDNEPTYGHEGCISIDDENRIHLKVGDVSTNEIELRYRKVSKLDFDVELRRYVTDEEILEYNDSLPSREILDDYLTDYQLYHMIRDHCIRIILRVHNIGTAKATDVSARVVFPSEISILNLEDVEDASEPEAPKKPRDLQEVVYRRAHKAEFALEKVIGQVETLGIPSSMDWPRISPMSYSDSIIIYDNTLNVKDKSIVHTKLSWFRGVYLVPLKRGVFKAKVALMCAEYEEPDEMEITFICE